jgi:glycosyltransferase involved in cell wall biosynthesis
LAYQLEMKQINRQTNKLLKSVLPRVDIIHSMGFDLKNFQDFPNITTLHNAFEFEDLDYYEQRQHFPYVSISNNQRRAYPSLNYVRTVYNGEDPDQFPINLKPQQYFCFISRFDREKGPHFAIQLAIHMGIPIKLAGKLDYHGSSYFRDEVKPYLDHHLVEYLGEIGFEDKVELLKNAMVNLHPITWREPFGLNVIEAGYCGTPTLGIRRGSMPEVIEEGKTGYMVEDFIEGVSMMNKCLELDRAKVAKAVRNSFNYQKMTLGYLHAYRKVIRKY